MKKILLSLLISSFFLTLATFDLSSLTSTTLTSPIDKVLTIKGQAQTDDFGYSSSNAGDVNGDGINDIIVGAYYKNSMQGAVYVIYGKENLENFDLSSKNLDPQTSGFTITGKAAGSGLGYSVNGLGDINGDGFDDIIIGTYGENQAYVIYGTTVQNSKDVPLASVTLEPQKTGFIITGVAGDYLGFTVSGAGDINNDEYADIICGAYLGSSGAGKAYVIYGKPTSSLTNYNLGSTSLDPGTTGFTVTGEVAGDHLGVSVSSAGDVNSDGFDDIIIGADQKNSKGAAYIIYGKAKEDLENLSVASLDSTDTGFRIMGSMASGQFGWSVAGAGDVNKDGYDDLIIGAPGENGWMGGVYVIYGNKKGNLPNLDLSSSSAALDSHRFYIKGEAQLNYLGFLVSSAGDINNDGYQDIIFGANAFNGRKGKIYVIYGKPKENLGNIDLATQPLEPTSAGFDITETASLDLFGNSVSTAGDFNGDDKIEILVGAPAFDNTRGAAYIIFPTRICVDNCNTCSQPSTCALCNNGYELNGANCSLCTKPATYSLGLICQECSRGCSKCTTGTTCEACFSGFTLFENEKCIDQTHTTAAANNTAAAFDGASLVGTALSSGSSLPMNFGLVAKIIRNIRYLDLSVSYELQETYYTWKTTSNFLKAPNSWKTKSESKELPYVFRQYALEPVFLINFWRPLLMTLIGLGLFIIFKWLEIATKGGENRQRPIVARTIHTAASNFALTQFYSNLDDAIFFFILELKSTKFDTGFRSISLVVACTVVILGVVLLVLHFLALRKYQRLRHPPNKKKGVKQQIQQFLYTFQNISLIFRDFKDQSLFQQTFLLLQISRSILASIITTTLYQCLPLQISLLPLLNVAMIIYLIKKQPFKESTDSLSQFFCEIILFIVNLCLILIASINRGNDSGASSIERLSKAIIVLNFILLIGGILFILLEVGKGFYKAYKERQKDKAPPLPNIQDIRPPEMVPRYQRSPQSDITTAAWLQNNTSQTQNSHHMNSTILETSPNINIEDQNFETSFTQSSPMRSKRPQRRRAATQYTRPPPQISGFRGQASELDVTIESLEVTNNEEIMDSNLMLQPVDLMTRQNTGRIKMPPGYRRNKSSNLIANNNASRFGMRSPDILAPIPSQSSGNIGYQEEIRRQEGQGGLTWDMRYEKFLQRKLGKEIQRENALKEEEKNAIFKKPGENR